MIYRSLYTCFFKSNQVSIFQSIKEYMPNIHKEGHLIIILFILADLVLFALADFLGWMGLIMVIWCFFFFRDPERITPIGDNLVVSPADGLVEAIVDTTGPVELGLDNQTMTRVSIFLSVFDVHVNRIPISGTVTELKYRHGKFFNASLDKASEHNERQSVLIKSDAGPEVAVIQIAGLIARRIVCDLNPKQSVKGGERFGIIRFGSRADVYLPLGTKINVLVGQRMIGGETIVANL